MPKANICSILSGMRWDNLLLDTDESSKRQGAAAGPVDSGSIATAKLPLFADEAIVRRFKTPEFKGMTFYEVMAKSIINHVASDRLGFSWTINPYRGCSHACTYCFARPTHTYLDFNAGNDFDTKIVVKVNSVDLLRHALRKPSWGGERIAMGTNTDPYQRAEGHYKLTRGIIAEFNAARNPYSILTKGTLIQRDIDLLVEGASQMSVVTSFSIGTVDEEVWKRTEPGTPHPMKRLEVVKKLNEAGVPCGVLMAPILPGISDSMEQLESTVRACAEAGVTHLSPIVLHLRRGVKEEFLPWLEAQYPDLVKTYADIYKRSNAPKDVAQPIAKAVHNFRRKYGAPAYESPAPHRTPEVSVAAAAPAQMSFAVEDEKPRRVPRWVKNEIVKPKARPQPKHRPSTLVARPGAKAS